MRSLRSWLAAAGLMTVALLLIGAAGVEDGALPLWVQKLGWPAVAGLGLWKAGAGLNAILTSLAGRLQSYPTQAPGPGARCPALPPEVLESMAKLPKAFEEHGKALDRYTARLDKHAEEMVLHRVAMGELKGAINQRGV